MTMSANRPAPALVRLARTCSSASSPSFAVAVSQRNVASVLGSAVRTAAWPSITSSRRRPGTGAAVLETAAGASIGASPRACPVERRVADLHPLEPAVDGVRRLRRTEEEPGARSHQAHDAIEDAPPRVRVEVDEDVPHEDEVEVTAEMPRRGEIHLAELDQAPDVVRDLPLGTPLREVPGEERRREPAAHLER